MKFAAKSLLFLMSLALTFAYAQTLPHFQHIIIVVQENRTPDNLFGAAGYPCGTEVPFETGADIENGGYGDVPQSNNTVVYEPICNTSLPLSSWDTNLPVNLQTIIDPDHGYIGWGTDYDGGNLDGFCHEYQNYSLYLSTCPSYSFVQRSDAQPYVDIAANYGFANYMFQTNEGPSFEAHQFLFTGTSAPVAPGKTNYLDFVAENPTFYDSGCPLGLNNSSNPRWVDPTGTEFSMDYYECYTHDSLVTDAADCTKNHCDRGTTWNYYTPTAGIIWDAPAGIPEVCYGQNQTNGTNPCGGAEWSHVILPDSPGHSDAPIFDDLLNCNLKQISWVIPDFTWSDHPQDNWQTNLGNVYGPSWVGDIIDAVGGGMKGSNCNGLGSGKYWTTEPTLILVVWDDWGGWFDHVPPLKVIRSSDKNSCPPTKDNPNGWGCGYTYGFRVPLLVVSPWTGTPTQNGYTGYISGACGASPLTPCPNNVPPFVHDFGSILRFTEHNFTMPQIAPPYYADANAPDLQPPGNIPLSDFFPLPLNQPRPFVPISTQKDFNYFRNFHVYNPGWVPTGPDDDNAADQ
jgi:phospholipase C